MAKKLTHDITLLCRDCGTRFIPEDLPPLEKEP